MKDLIGKIVRKKEQSSSCSPPQYSRLSSCCEDEVKNKHQRKHDQVAKKRGYVPIMVGKSEEEEERFMVPLGWMNHPCIVELLRVSANEFGYHQQGVSQIPCEPHHFRVVMESISCK
ncbi:auxin-responsive protein SAUR71-like [Chenopodium quinoa]|uniref:Uncharacterized protein n=1 Tax=Chenopodium quinoa TaxID=63459 RepID=A0A803NEQ7_CHEQI|nr:auxin-responsive protein SAUR71-like [Chenopodium quinoa]